MKAAVPFSIQKSAEKNGFHMDTAAAHVCFGQTEKTFSLREGLHCQRRWKAGRNLKKTQKIANGCNLQTRKDFIKYAQKQIQLFMQKDRCAYLACKVTVFLQRIFDFSTGFIEAQFFQDWGFTSSILCDSMRKNNQTKGLHDDDTE